MDSPSHNANPTNLGRVGLLPRLLKVYAVVATLLFGWTVFASVLMVILIATTLLKEGTLSFDWKFVVLAFVFVLQFVYAATFLASSVSVLRRRAAHLPTFRVCALIFNGYVVLCPIAQLAILPFVPRDSRALAVSVVCFSVAIAAGVTMATRRLLPQIASLLANQHRVLPSQMT